MNEIVEIVSTVGFPIAVCIYLLYERTRNTDKAMSEVRDAIRDLHILIAERIDKD